MDIRFAALGGGREIGANSFYYYLNGTGILVDGGLHPEKSGWDAFPKVEVLSDAPVDAVIVTHAHTDHLGGIPYVMQSFPEAPVYASSETVELANVMLGNSASLMPRQHPEEVIRKLTNYTVENLPNVLSTLREFPLGGSLEIKGVKVTSFPSGHILGAMGLLFEAGGQRIFHTADTSLHEQQLVAGASLPDGPVDILVSEATNGLNDAYLSHDREEELTRLLNRIKSTIEGEGSVLIPVFALGKMQEILSMLWAAMEAGRIPTVDIYTGGMARKISTVYDNHINSLSRRPGGTCLADIPQQEVPRRDGLFHGKYFREPSIVLAASGMMQDGTSSYMLSQRWLRQKTFAICFVGYTDPRTPGHIVSHATMGDRVRFGSMKRDVPVRCHIERFRFSAHARREELLEIVRRLKPKQVVLTHADEATMLAFGETIQNDFSGTLVTAPYNGKWYQLGKETVS